ncbi:alkaline phosphatase family protein [Schaalia sp. ZJ1691]|uniref:alkaline phosphatase family protein n=1 Tax=Schaalia sp. ZJ1691 TaxID=2709404 RepID=UPI0013E9DF93|nr:alkaline phosphatase family protein [Schaalia sp. ZJ1691]
MGTEGDLVGGSAALALVPGADVPDAGGMQLTDVFAASLATIDSQGRAFRRADHRARMSLGLDAGARQLLVILVDGLGAIPLSEHFGHAPTLRSFRDSMRSIHTVVPSTTAAAITAFGTGAHPGATRMVGYSILYNMRVMNLLAFDDGPAPEQWQPQETHFETLRDEGATCAVISPPSFAGSGLTRAALRGAHHVGALSWNDRIDAALAQLRQGVDVVYLYWSDIDHAGHSRGVGSLEWVSALEEFDAGLSSLLRRLPRGVRTILTADHGMVNIAQNTIIDVASTPELAQDVVAIAGETRAVHVHARRGSQEAVRQRWREFLGERAWVIDPAVSQPLIGAGDGGEVIGAALVLMRERFGVVDSRTQSPQAIAMPGVHGSLTSEEMRIPVIELS